MKVLKKNNEGIVWTEGIKTDEGDKYIFWTEGIKTDEGIFVFDQEIW
jgi:hypothetical protein